MKKHKYLFFLLFCTFILHQEVNSQNSQNLTQNYHPVTPGVFQFLKYDEMPVSEYTGIPNISIPLYTLEEDRMSVPLNLTYHAGGIRVNQEASWVGLGWDLNVGGSIVQEINDKDDYDPNITRQLIDWRGYGPPYEETSAFNEFSKSYFTDINNPPPSYIYTPEARHSYAIFSSYKQCIYPLDPQDNYYVPINGNLNDMNLSTRVVYLDRFDSEPDIFSANFMGHSLKFILDWNTNQIVVLNKKGYRVKRIGDAYKIIVPSGEEFDFEINSTTFNTEGYTDSISWKKTSKMWMLTKVITNKKAQIRFNYSRSELTDNYPDFSQQFDSIKTMVSNRITSGGSTLSALGYPSFPIQSAGKTTKVTWSSERTSILVSNWVLLKDNKLTLSSIETAKGKIVFFTSNRSDVQGTKELDSIQIFSSNYIKSYKFHYAYFDASSVGGNNWESNSNNISLDIKRLKLISLENNSGAIHNFTYNNTPLPSKNSYAQDVWGFYNGQLANTMLYPSGVYNTDNFTVTIKNGNNGLANLAYTKAGILEQIQYPTGGKVIFDYELNEFSNSWNSNTSMGPNLTTQGNGLRIKNIYYQNIEGINDKHTVYSYFGGKDMLPVYSLQGSSFNEFQLHDPYSDYPAYNLSYSMYLLNAKGFYSTNLLGSGNYVGYDKVIKQEIENGTDVGKTESYFYNNPDIVSKSGQPYLNVILPAIKNKDVPENGTLKSILIYDQDSVLLKKIENTYNTYLSDIYYGCRVFGYTSRCYNAVVLNGEYRYWVILPRALVGYYPIYDKRSLIETTKTTDYFSNGSVSTFEKSYYDSYDRVQNYIKSNDSIFNPHTNGQVYSITNNYCNSMSGTAVYDSMLVRNMISPIVRQLNYYYNSNNTNTSLVSDIKINYDLFLSNKLILPSTIQERSTSSSSFRTIQTFSQYNSFGNIIEMQGTNNVKEVYLWSYNGQYPIAKIEGLSYEEVYSKLTGFISYIGISVPTVPLLNNIRTMLASTSALVTTYTYKPLVGILTKTDPRGVTTTYEYDSFNHLQYIKDTSGKIIQKFNYNYKH